MIIIGYILTTLGIIGMSIMGISINNDSYYTYKPPLTTHETTMLMWLFIFIVMAVIGLQLIIFSIVKKRNEDSLNRISDYGENGNRKNVCPKCELNLSQGANICPRCGSVIKKE